MTEFTAICVDGPKRGTIFTAPGNTIQYAVPSENIASLYERDDPPTVIGKTGTYHGHRFRLAGYGEAGWHVYRVWSTKALGPDHMDVIFTLIDADPADARRVRVQ